VGGIAKLCRMPSCYHVGPHTTFRMHHVLSSPVHASCQEDNFLTSGCGLLYLQFETLAGFSAVVDRLGE
jgi:hypothetical protein